MGPLEGLRVVELAGIGPVPFAGMVLADLGADAVRVDRIDGNRPLDAHRILDRGRRSVALDLKDPRAVEVVLRMAQGSDVLVEGFRPGVAERLGFGPEECRRRNARLVYARMTGWGQDGPLAGAPGHDINYLALSGALDAIGPAGGPPVPPLNVLGDFAGGGLLLVTGILAALYERERSGLGQVVDAAILDGVAGLLSMLHALTAAGQWLPAADLPDRADPANWPELRRVFAARFADRTRDAWLADFSGTDACVTPVLTLAESVADAHHQARGTYRAGEPAPAPRFSRTRGAVRRPAPAPGEHTREVLTELGLAGSEIDDLLRGGVAADIRFGPATAGNEGA